MKKYLIAGIKIAFNYKYDTFFKDNIDNYLYNGPDDVDYIIDVHFKEVLDAPTGDNYYIFSKSVSGVKSYMTYDKSFKQIDLWIDSDAFNDTAAAEYIYSGMIFMYLAEQHGLIAIQGTAINYLNDIILFAAPSGTGKTTHAIMWKSLFGKDVDFVTDLKPLLKVEGDKVLVLPTPFSDLNSNDYLNHGLKSIVFLTRGVGESIVQLDTQTGLKKLTANTIKPIKSTLKDLKPKLEEIASLVDFYEFNVTLSKKSPLTVKTELYK